VRGKYKPGATQGRILELAVGRRQRCPMPETGPGAQSGKSTHYVNATSRTHRCRIRTPPAQLAGTARRRPAEGWKMTSGSLADRHRANTASCPIGRGALWSARVTPGWSLTIAPIGRLRAHLGARPAYLTTTGGPAPPAHPRYAAAAISRAAGLHRHLLCRAGGTGRDRRSTGSRSIRDSCGALQLGLRRRWPRAWRPRRSCRRLQGGGGSAPAGHLVPARDAGRGARVR
jgi:hypothetical protein